MLNLQTNGCLELGFGNVDQHTGTKWLIHSTQHHKDKELQISIDWNIYVLSEHK